MKGVTETKGLQNLKTATTTRLRAKPAQLGTTHLDMYLLSKERHRLEQELEHLEKRRERIRRQIAEVSGELGRLRVDAQREETGGMSDGGTVSPSEDQAGPSPAERAQPQWKTMPLEY